jgi:hypothetical protein
MKIYEGVEVQLLDLGTQHSLVVSFMPWPLYRQEKTLQCPMDRRK